MDSKVSWKMLCWLINYLINNIKILSSQKLGGNQLPVFAVLSSKNITFYESESPETHYLKDLALNDIHFLEVYIIIM